MGNNPASLSNLIVMLVSILCCCQIAQATTLDTSDADRFALLFDKNQFISADTLQENYIEKAGPGVKYIMGNIQSSQKMSKSINRASEHYERAIRVCLPAVKAIKSDAIDMVSKIAHGTNTKPAQFISIVFGANNVAATATPNGIILAFETLCQQTRDVEHAKAVLLEYIAHEMVHVAQYQLTQRTSFSFNLLEMSLIEGTADFISSLYLNKQSMLQHPRNVWGETHALSVWRSFVANQHDKHYASWLYKPSASRQPADMGYWIGNQIAEHFYDSSANKENAIQQLLIMEDADVIFRKSGVLSSTIRLNINGVELEYEDTGMGQQVVVFDAGFGTKNTVWQSVINRLPMNIRTITYSRSELNPANEDKGARTVEEHLADLRGLLDRLEIDVPILYVTHSYSGMIAARYAQTHPDELSGMIMIEPATQAQRKHFLKVDAALVHKEDEMILSYLPAQLGAQYSIIVEQMERASDKVQGIPADIPTVVFSAGNASSEPFSINETEQGKPVWLALHAKLVQGSEQHKHRIIDTVSHNIHKRSPELIASQIKAMIAME